MGHARLNYEELVASYWESLTTVLRGFVPSAEYPFLETWIHDEDDVSSILNLLDAAAQAGIERVSLHLGKATLARLDMERLRQETGMLGLVSLEPEGQGVDLDVALRQVVPPLAEIASRYRAALAAILSQVTHEETLTEAGESMVIDASRGGATLAIQLDPRTHVITQAVHRGAHSQVLRGLLEGLCRWMEGVPILEAADHGMIHLENQLRDPAEGRPVLGVVMPENADQAFLLPLKLVRALCDSYRQRTGYSDTRSEYERPVAAAWQALATEAAMQRIAQALATSPFGRGIALVALQNRRRVVVSFSDDVEVAARPSRLLQIEAMLRSKVEPMLEVHLEPKRDELTIRLKKGVRP